MIFWAAASDPSCSPVFNNYRPPIPLLSQSESRDIVHAVMLSIVIAEHAEHTDTSASVGYVDRSQQILSDNIVTIDSAQCDLEETYPIV